jgi:hypothetical protein
MPPTIRGVFHNLKESEYVVSNKEITFFFSSETYLNKFLETYQDERKKLQERTKKELTHVNFNMNTLADITLYRTIEKRGFLARLKGVDMKWEDLEKYVLRKMTDDYTHNWSRIARAKVKRTFQKYGVDLTEEVSIPSLDSFQTREEFNKWKEKAGSFTNRNNQKFQFVKNEHGVVASKSLLNEISRNRKKKFVLAERKVKRNKSKPCS